MYFSGNIFFVVITWLLLALGDCSQRLQKSRLIDVHYKTLIFAYTSSALSWVYIKVDGRRWQVHSSAFLACLCAFHIMIVSFYHIFVNLLNNGIIPTYIFKSMIQYIRWRLAVSELTLNRKSINTYSGKYHSYDFITFEFINRESSLNGTSACAVEKIGWIFNWFYLPSILLPQRDSESAICNMFCVIYISWGRRDWYKVITYLISEGSSCCMQPVDHVTGTMYDGLSVQEIANCLTGDIFLLMNDRKINFIIICEFNVRRFQIYCI